MENLQYFAGSLLVGFLLVLLLMESFVARRALQSSFAVRWLSNLGLGAINFGIGRLLALLAGVSAASLFAEYHIGLFNNVNLPLSLEAFLGLLMLDLTRYGEHRLVHAVPVLWRLHLVHHSDTDVDATTHFRHHPGELVVSYSLGIVAMAILGLSAATVAFYGLLFSFLSVLQHANIRLPDSADRLLRWIVVTPDVHRVHHSSYQPETDSNFGSVLTLWDRLFGSYVPSPKDGHEGMQLGLDWCTDKSDLWLHRVLFQPVLWRTTARASTGGTGNATGTQ